MKRLRVTRILVYEGPEDWIRTTLDQSPIRAVGLELHLDRATIQETSRVVQEIKEDGE